jgi:zinc transporter family protein
VRACPGVRDIHDLRTRFSGDRTFVEYHLEVDPGLTVDVGHAIGDATEIAVQNLLPGVVEATAHVEPHGIDDARLDDAVARKRRPSAGGWAIRTHHCPRRDQERGHRRDRRDRAHGGAHARAPALAPSRSRLSAHSWPIPSPPCLTPGADSPTRSCSASTGSPPNL